MTPEARAARERKQKIFVVVGGLFLLALLAIQLPKLLGGSSSPEAAATTTTTPRRRRQPAHAGARAGGARRAPRRDGRSSRRSRSSTRKDPFVQQVVDPDGTEPTPRRRPQTGRRRAAGRLEAPKPTTFSTGKAAAAAVTIVTVNGARQVLEPGMKFPAADPLFVLVAEKPGSKSVVVGIVGGAYAGGAKTTTLKVGKPLTLVNTTTGARYKISLVSVGSGERPSRPRRRHERRVPATRAASRSSRC